IHVEVHLAAEHHRAVRKLCFRFDKHADDSNLAVPDLQVFNGIAAAESVENIPVHGKRMDSHQRRARVRVAARRRWSRSAQATATSRGVDSEQERETIPVQRRDDPCVPKESDGRELEAARLRTIARDVLLEVAGAAPLPFAPHLFDRLLAFVAGAIALADRDLAYEPGSIPPHCGWNAIVHEDGLADERAQRGRRV